MRAAREERRIYEFLSAVADFFFFFFWFHSLSFPGPACLRQSKQVSRSGEASWPGSGCCHVIEARMRALATPTIFLFFNLFQF